VIVFISQWEQSSDDKKSAKLNEERKSAKLKFHHLANKNNTQ
jgi:hypothetical protein